MCEKVFIINGSPRSEKGISYSLAKRCQFTTGGEIIHLYHQLNNLQQVLAQINQAEKIIIIGPCYINTFPAHVIALLEMLHKHPEVCHGQKLYGIINGGMPYVHTHEVGIKQLELFCKQVNLCFGGGFVVGAGPIIDGKKLEAHPAAKKLIPAFNAFIQCIHQGKKASDTLYKQAEFKVPSIVVKGFTWQMNRTIDKNLKKHGFSPKQISPYLGKTLVIYASRTGFTEKYARWIAEALDCPIIPIEKVDLYTLQHIQYIIFGGGIYGGKINGLKKMLKQVSLEGEKKLIFFTTGAAPAIEKEIERIRATNLAQCPNVPFFYFRSGLNYDKMGFKDRGMMKCFVTMLNKQKNLSVEQQESLKWMQKSYDLCSKEDIEPLLEVMKVTK